MGVRGISPHSSTSTPQRSRCVVTARQSVVAASLAAAVVCACSRSDSSAVSALAGVLTLQKIASTVRVHPPDAFYEPPSEVPHRPGVLLREEPLYHVTLPPHLRGWRLLYTTTVDDATPATAVATVFAPYDSSTRPRPVIAWAHGTTGVLQKCMPSLASAPTLGIPATDRIAAAGWVIVATDYAFVETGGPHPYLIGEGEARSALDSVRAARQMRELTLADRTVVWGHSQGGHAALWTGIAAPRYAPDVTVAGVAAIAPAADMRHILDLNQNADKRLAPYLALAYSRFYPDVTFEQALRPAAVSAAREMASLCGFFPREDPKRIATLAASFDGRASAVDGDTPFVARLKQNAATGAIAAPLVIAQGGADAIVSPRATDAYVGERCAAGQRLEYWTVAARDHGSIVQPGTPLEPALMAWTNARFGNEPATAGCVRRSF